MTVFVRRLPEPERRWWQRRRTPHDVAWVEGGRVEVQRTSHLGPDVRRWLGTHPTDIHDIETAATRAAGDWSTVCPPGPTDEWVRATAATLADLARPTDPDLTASLERLARPTETGPDLARRVLGLYGGAGSLDDVVLWEDGHVAPAMVRFDALRSLLRHLAVELR